MFLGTGGKAGLFRHTTAGPENTGDGHAMAYRAGAQLMNLEFKRVFLARFIRQLTISVPGGSYLMSRFTIRMGMNLSEHICLKT